MKPKWDPLNRKVGMLPPMNHFDPDMDMDDTKDGKTNKTRQVGVKARFPGTNDHLKSATRLAVWCVCDNSKADKGADTYPGHWRSCYGPKNVSAMHPNMLEKGSTYVKPVFAKVVGKRKRGKDPAANAVTAESQDTGKIVEMLEMGETVTKNYNKIVDKFQTSESNLAKQQ